MTAPVQLVILSRVFAMAAMLLVIPAAYLAVESFSLSVRRIRLSAAALFAFAVLVGWQGTRVLHRFQDGPDVALSNLTDFLTNTFPAVFAVLLLAEVVAELVLLRRLRSAKLKDITPDSVKEALDALPDGVCFSARDGFPLLVNEQMGELAHDAFGVALLDERTLWERLSAGDCQPGYAVERIDVLEEGKGTLLVEQGGHAWQFARRELVVETVPVVETIATNVTEEYGLVKQLEERNERIAAVNERLRVYGRDLARITRDEEILSMKATVHNEVGRALIALRAYGEQDPAQRDRAALLELWHRVAHLLESSEQTEDATDNWVLLVEAAEAIGVKVMLTGKLPTQSEARELAVAIVHECLNNAVRHGGAHTLLVSCVMADGAVELEVSNDGTPPTAPVVESGGLSNIRAAVERLGGTLTICWEPRVLVRARFVEEASWQRHGSSSWMTSALRGSTSS